MLLGLALFENAARAEELAITEQSVFSFYKSLALLTPAPVWVSARLAADCVAPSPSVVAEEERRFGPHADALINLYANDAAKQAIASGSHRFPPGGVIVKEKVAGDGGNPVTAVGGMVKRAPGFDPANGDWEYFYAARSGGFAMGARQLHRLSRPGEIRRLCVRASGRRA